MGRDLSFHLVNPNIQHDTSRKICLNYEFQPTCDELKEQLHTFLYPNHDESEYSSLKKAQDNCLVENKLNVYEKNNIKPNADWCQRCHMFADGLHCSTANLTSISFQNSYSNPIWSSDWHFYNMHPGSSHSDFCNRFSQDKMYRQISRECIDNINFFLNDYGKAYRTDDLDALNETQRVIDFCERFIDEPDRIIIYSSEL
jgi:hypothetical protein